MAYALAPFASRKQQQLPTGALPYQGRGCPEKRGGVRCERLGETLPPVPGPDCHPIRRSARGQVDRDRRGGPRVAHSWRAHQDGEAAPRSPISRGVGGAGAGALPGGSLRAGVSRSMAAPGTLQHDSYELLRDNGLAERATVHGLRSSFRAWCAKSGFFGRVAEAALAHTVRGVEGAYLAATDPSPGASNSCRRASRTGKPSRLRSHHFTILVEFTVCPPNTGRHRGPKSGALGSPLCMPNGPRMSGGAKRSWFTPSSPLTTPPVARRAASRLRPDPEGSRTLPASGEHCAAGAPVPTRDESSQAWAWS